MPGHGPPRSRGVRLLHLSVAVALAAACQAGQDPLATGGCVPGDSTIASIAASVRDAATGEPVADAEVAAPSWAATTDRRGHACVERVEPGLARVRVHRLGFLDARDSLETAAGRTSRLTVSLRRAAPPCCRLEGAWRARFHLDSAGTANPLPGARSTGGLLVFSDDLPDAEPLFGPLQDPVVRHESGRHEVDFDRFWERRAAPGASDSVPGMGPWIFKEVVGIVPAADSVYVVIVPRMSHGGFSLSGRISGDTVRGRWEENAYCCGAKGRFTMYRVPWTPGADSMVARGIREHARGLREAEAAEAERGRRVGQLRLRTFDLAARRYVSAKYWINSLGGGSREGVAMRVDSPDGGWSGWGPVEPGTYSLELSEYPCGEQMYFVDEASARQQLGALEVVIESGKRTEKTVRIDTRKLRAARSYDNPDGRSCER